MCIDLFGSISPAQKNQQHPARTLVAERLLYIPSLGFLLLLVCFLRDAGGSAICGTTFRAAATGHPTSYPVPYKDT